MVKFSQSCGPDRLSENDNLTEITIFEPVVVHCPSGVGLSG